MSTLFEQQLAAYASYHRDPRNRATHFIGIPAIVFSLLLPFALWRFSIAGFDLSAAWVLAAVAAIGWIALDRSIGFAMLAMLIPMLLIAEWIVRAGGTAAAWWTFAIFFVGGWIFQLVGHAAFEGRRPALLDNLFQAFVGPMFIMAEVFMMLGLRKDLAHLIEHPPAERTA
jgi:uncharacterized membrane protein YGL010W